MHAARLIAPGTIEFADVAEPRPSAGEVLIAPLRLGICGSDVSIYQGHRQVPLPLTPGHEVVGRVAALGSEVTGFVPGQRVIVEIDDDELWVRSEGSFPLLWVDFGQHHTNVNQFLRRVDDFLDE